MTPQEYVDIVVIPTVREFMAKPDDRRLAYTASILTYHVVDYLMRTASPPDRAALIAERERIESALLGDIPEFFSAVEGMCNGTKHCGRDNRKRQQFTPGDEEHVPPFGFGEGFSGFGFGRWGTAGLVVVVGTERVFIDHAVIAFLLACQRLFPSHLSGIDSSRWSEPTAAVEPQADAPG